MHIKLICPAPPGSTTGNRVTAVRWARLLRELGHRVTIDQTYDSGRCDVLVAMHARKSAAAVFRSRELEPQRPVIVALTGTDLYRDIHNDRNARRALELADRAVLLQPSGIAELPADVQSRARVILQSAIAPRAKKRRGDWCQLAVVGHLRDEKDPFRAVEAAKLLPASARIRIVHAGGALDPGLDLRARNETSEHYRWLGEVSPARARRLIADSDGLILSSVMEGGANVLSEAIVAGVPVLASRIPSSVAILGERYPGFFETGNNRELANLMLRFCSDAEFRRSLIRWVKALAPNFRPAREKQAWRSLLSELF